MHEHMQTGMQNDAIAMLRTDGRTNERVRHHTEIKNVSEVVAEKQEFEVDSLTEYLLGCSPATTETERLGNFGRARKESFGHAAHRHMLAFHEIQKAQFHHARSVNEAFLYRQRNNDPRRTTA